MSLGLILIIILVIFLLGGFRAVSGGTATDSVTVVSGSSVSF